VGLLVFSILYYAPFYFQFADFRTITACGTTQPETNAPEATVTPAQEANTTEDVVAEDTASSQTTEETSAETPAGPQGFPVTVEVCGAYTYANDAADIYGVNNDSHGNLEGYAWGTNVGWQSCVKIEWKLACFCQTKTPALFNRKRRH